MEAVGGLQRGDGAGQYRELCVDQFTGQAIGTQMGVVGRELLRRHGQRTARAFVSDPGRRGAALGVRLALVRSACFLCVGPR
ncbi:hypothetical protein [Streptomyces sp. NPDC051211]|uniref:hypothetical protein n=1 Tax=Streptomyces sp. NPDC051211 TaxID=3154643 RepID=UPI00344EBC54